MARQLAVSRLTPKGERSRLRSAAAALTSLGALAATSLVAGPASAAPVDPCALARTSAHHSEGVRSWNSAYPRPVRDVSAVMVFLSFPDSRDLAPTSRLAADHFPATSRFYSRSSYGKLRLHAHPMHSWVRMPKPSTAYAIKRDWATSDRNAYIGDAVAAADPLVDFSRYDVVYFVADPDAPGVDSDATKVVNFDQPLHPDGTRLRRIVTVFERHPPDRNVLAHETGHAFDLPDLYHRPSVDGKGDWDTFVGDWDLMGSQFGLAPDFFAWHKWRFGWLDRRQVTCLRGDERLTLAPVAAPPESASAGPPPRRVGPVLFPVTSAAGAQAPGAGRRGVRAYAGREARKVVHRPLRTTVERAVGAPATRLAVVRTGRDSVLAIEARSRVGNDSTTCTEGVLLYRVTAGVASGEGPVRVIDTHPHTEACSDDSVYPPLADAPLRAGESYQVPGAHLRVSVDGRTRAGEWMVRVRTE